MRKILVLLTMLTLGNSICAASGGKSIIPFWIKNSYNDCHIFITNISSNSVTVYVTLYDQDGNIYTESSEAGEDITPSAGFSTDPTENSGATLGSQKTGDVNLLSNSTTKFGYVVIEWKSVENAQFPLVAHLQQNHKNDGLNRYGRTVIPANEFRPF